MKKLMLFLLAALLSFAAANAQGTATIVVADSTATNSNVPVHGTWADAYLRCQVIYPEAMMSELVGSEMQGVTYYLSSPASEAWTGTFEVKIGTVANATFDGTAWADVSTFATVYTGTLDGTGSQITINFSTPFVYTGGNLLIETSQIVSGNYKSCSFYGKTSTGSSLQNYNSSSWESITGSQRNFIPKTGFIVSVTCAAPAFTTILPSETSASIAWNEVNAATSWSLKVNDGEWTTINDNPYNLTGLTSNTAYTISLRSICNPGDTSFITTTSFRTTCGTQTLPYIVGFEPFAAGTNNMAECWTSLEGTNYVRDASAYASQGTKSLYISDSGVVATPVIAVGGNDVYINFDLLRGTAASGKMAVGFALSPDMVASAIYVDTINPADNSYHNYEYAIPNTIHLPSGCIVFKQIESTSATAYYCIDSLQVLEYSGCLRPVSGTIANVTPSTATVNWVAGTDAVSYEVAYDTLDAIAATTSIVPSNTTSVTITGLESETEYNVWVRSVCGAESTLWRYIGNFTTEPACAPVSDVTVANVTYNAIALNWTINDTIGYSSTMVQVEYKKNSDSDWSETTTTDNYIMITGLEAGTNYNIRVRNVCGTDSASVVALNASTQACEVEVAPGGATIGYIPTYGFYNYSYTQAIYTNAEVGNLDTITGISFKYNGTASFNRTVDVYLANIPDATLDAGYIDISEFTQVATGYSWAISNGWKSIIFDEPFVHQAGNDIVIAIDDNTGTYSSVSGTTFAAHAGSGLYKYNDATNYDPTNPPTGSVAQNVPDIRFATVCHLDGCQAPLVMVNEVTQHEVSLLWTAMGSEPSWTVAHRLSGEENWTVDDVNATATSYTISGLNAGSSYQIRVGANCGSDTAYTEVSTFTECDVVNMPYTEGFEAYTAGTGNFPQCWTNISNTSNYVQSGTGYASAGNNGLHIQGPGTVATPIIAFGGNDIYVKFDMKRSSSYGGSVAVGIAASSSAEDVEAAVYFDTVAPSDQTYHTYEFTYNNTTNIQNGCVVFKQIGITSTTYYYNLDELTVSEPPSCIHPSALEAETTETSLTLSWTENGSATQWVMKVNDGNFETITTNPYTLNGLTANTPYTITLAALCNGTDTSETITGTFRTACGTEILPYAEDFESYTAGSNNFPACWTSVSGSNYVQQDGNSGAAAGKALHFQGPGVVTTPVINVGGNNLFISFDLMKEGSSSGSMAVGYALSPDAIESTVFMDTINPASEDVYINHEYTFENTMNIQSGCIVFKQICTSSVWYYWLDNLTVSVVSDCQRPDSGMVANITPVSATASWSVAALATEYEVAYGASADVNNADTIVSATNTTLDLTDLTPATTYYVWVRTVCGAERTLWRALGSFTTQPACAQVVNARVENAGITDMTIAWNIDATVGYASTEVRVLYKKATGQTWNNANDTIVSGTQLALTDLEAGTTYNFRIYNICSNDTATMVTLNGTTQVACAQVVDAHTLATAMTAISLGWSIDENVGYTSTEVLVSYREAGATEWIDTVVTSNYIVLTGLETATTYNFRIRNICGSDTASYVTLNVATNACGEVGDGSTTITYIPTYPFYNYSYTQAIYTDAEVGSIDTIHGIWFNSNGTNSPTRNIDVYVADIPNASVADSYIDIAQFTQVATGYSWTVANGWSHIVFDQPFVHQAGNDIVIAVDDNTGSYQSNGSFVAHTGNGRYAYNDPTNYDPTTPPATSYVATKVPDIRFDAVCNLTCPAPMVVVDGVGQHDVTLLWTSLGEETSWTVEYKRLSDTTWTSFAANYTTTSCSITGLDGATDYQFRVGANCTDAVSYGAASALTECAAYVVTTTQDFVQNFETTSLPRCWDNESSTTGTWYNMTGGHSGRTMYFEGYSAGTATLVTPELDCSALNLGAQVRFWYKLPSNYDNENATLKLYYRTAMDGAWTAIPSAVISEAASGWTEGEIVLPNSENAASYQIAFEVTSGEGFDYDCYAYLDEVVVEAVPTCPRPADITLEDVTSSSATLSWTSDAPLFEVKYRVAGNGWNIVNPAPTTSTVQLTGLATATSYVVSIRAICTPGDTSRTVTYTFSTECDIITATALPHLEGFESGITCWTQEMLSGSGEWEVNPDMSDDNYNTISAQEGTSFVGMVMDTYDETVTRLISPTFDLTGVENAKVKFAHVQPIYDPDQDNLIVEYRLSQTSDWQTLVTYTEDISTWRTDSIELPAVSATFQLAFRARCVYGHGVAIDSVLISADIQEIPTCDVPTNITTSNLTANTVTVTWTGSAAQYQVEIVGGGQTFTQTVNTNSYTIETLTQETPYTVRVRALCDNGLTSDWSSVVNFTTPQPECGVPTNVQTTTTATSVTITWTGYASEYDVKVTGSEIAPINRTVNTNSCTIDGLVPASTYQVVVRAKCNGQYTDWTAPTTFYTADGEGIDDIQSDFSVSLFPNPAKTSVTLKVDGLNGKADVMLIDMSGRTVMTNTMDGNDELQFNVTNLAKGTYFVRISGDSISTVRKLVVQ